MKYGVVLPLSGIDGSVEKLLAYGQMAEEAGWDGVFLEDYIVYWGEQGITYDPWLLLTALALRTRRIRLGMTVTPLPSRLPWKLAREAITLDYLSQGRLILGFGLGDAQDIYFGEVSDLKQRAEMLDEALDLLAGLMSEQPFTYQGKHYRANHVTFLPGPLQKPRIPIWVGGYWPRKAPALRAARWDGFCPARLHDENGDGYIKPADIRAIKALVAEHRTAPAPFDLVVGGHTPHDDPTKARAHVEAYIDAGATWWVEFVLPDPGEAEQALARIRQGPPQ